MSWLENFTYRKKIPIVHRTQGSLSDYQMKIAIFSGNGSDTNGTVYLNNNSKNWPNDIRFTQADGVTQVDHWIQMSSNVTNKAIFWVKIPTIDSSTDTDYYIYYGNSNAATSSNISDTWIVAEDWSSDLSNKYKYVDDTVPTSYNRAYYATGNVDGDNFISSVPYRTLHFFLISAMSGTDPNWAAHVSYGICETSGSTGNNYYPHSGMSQIDITRDDNSYGTDSTHFYWYLHAKSGSLSKISGNQLHKVNVNNQWFIGEIQHHTSYISGIIWSGTNFNETNPSSTSITDPTYISYSASRYHFWRLKSSDTRSPYYIWDYDANRNNGVKIAGAARGDLLQIPTIYKYVVGGKLAKPEPSWGAVGAEQTSESTPVIITNVSGCIASSSTWATLSAKITNGSGNVTFYYESGATGGGTTPSNWDSNVSYDGIVYSGNYITKKITGLTPKSTYSFRGYISSNGWGGGEDWFDATDTFTTTINVTYDEGPSMRIYYSCNNYPSNYIDCWCTRWDESNWDVTIETILHTGARNVLFRNLKPGSVRELMNILGTPYFIDTTYESGNTLIIEPISGYGLSGLRQRRTIGIKSISDTFLNNNLFNVKIEGKRLDT